MDANSKLRPVRLIDHLIGIGSDNKAQANVFAAIYRGDIQATIAIHPKLPANPSNRDIIRYANCGSQTVSAMSKSTIKTAISDAALGRNPDLATLAGVFLHIPDDVQPDKPVIVKRVTAAAAHRENILTAIVQLGYERQALPREKRGTKGVPSKVREFLDKRITRSQFEKAWEAMMSEGLIRYA